MFLNDLQYSGHAVSIIHPNHFSNSYECLPSPKKEENREGERGEGERKRGRGGEGRGGEGAKEKRNNGGKMWLVGEKDKGDNLREARFETGLEEE